MLPTLKKASSLVAAARAAGAALALLTAAALSSPLYPKGDIAQADGWGILTALAVLLNVPAMAAYLLRIEQKERGIRRLIPMIDAMLPFFAACGFTVILTTRLDTGYSYLFSVWLVGLGLMHVALRHVMPAGIRVVGMYYLACGMAMLLLYTGPFEYPWPMGIMLFIGESSAAIAMLVKGNPVSQHASA